jgi:hypothetical protein
LTTICRDADELEFFKGLKIGEEEIEILEAATNENGG